MEAGDPVQEDSTAGRLSRVGEKDSPATQLPSQPAEASKETDAARSGSPSRQGEESGAGAEEEAAETGALSPTISPRHRRFLLGDDIEPIRED